MSISDKKIRQKEREKCQFMPIFSYIASDDVMLNAAENSTIFNVSKSILTLGSGFTLFHSTNHSDTHTLVLGPIWLFSHWLSKAPEYMSNLHEDRTSRLLPLLLF